jgi:hypothetical protein
VIVTNYMAVGPNPARVVSFVNVTSPFWLRKVSGFFVREQMSFFTSNLESPYNFNIVDVQKKL